MGAKSPPHFLPEEFWSCQGTKTCLKIMQRTTCCSAKGSVSGGESPLGAVGIFAGRLGCILNDVEKTGKPST